MKRKHEFMDYIEDILDAVEKIEQFTGGMSYGEFSRDAKTVFAVIRAFEIIGEATKNVPPAFRQRHPEIPWKKMAGMRDKMIHEYFGVDHEVVWKTIQRDVPALKRVIAQAIEDETQKERGENH